MSIRDSAYLQVIGCLALFLMLSIPSCSLAQGVGINTSSPDPSALVDMNSSTQGMLIPRMSQEERDAITDPAAGLQIFNTTTNCINLFSGTWRQICSECEFPKPSAGSNSPVCEGSNIQLFATTIAGATYSWSGPNDFTSNDQNPIISDVDINHSGAYSVEVTFDGCTSTPVTVFVVVHEIPSAPDAFANSPLCESDQLNLSANSSSGAQFQWWGPEAFFSVQQNPVILNVSEARSGTYYVTASVHGCISQAGSVDVEILSEPAQPGAISGPAVVCPGSEDVEYAVAEVDGATSYSWSVFDGASVASGQGSVNVTLDFTSGNGSLCVTATGTCGSSSPSCLPISAGQFTQGSSIFTTSGSDASFVVPPGINVLQIKSWAGGGGGGVNNNTGGPGGYVEGVVSVTPGETLTVRVGLGGNGPCNGDCSSFSAFAVFPGGAGGGQGNGGGGYSGIFRSSTPLLIAGAGGGGGGGNNGTLKRGGAGGGITGQDGDDFASGGKGGTQSTGGAGGSTIQPPPDPGSYLTGGSGFYGGGGGGGYYGGGGGGWAGSWLHMGGGGGSSFVINTAVCTQNLAGDKSSPSIVPNQSDTDYVSGVGIGGYNSSGGSGRVVIRW